MPTGMARVQTQLSQRSNTESGCSFLLSHPGLSKCVCWSESWESHRPKSLKIDKDNAELPH